MDGFTGKTAPWDSLCVGEMLVSEPSPCSRGSHSLDVKELWSGCGGSDWFWKDLSLCDPFAGKVPLFESANAEDHREVRGDFANERALSADLLSGQEAFGEHAG